VSWHFGCNRQFREELVNIGSKIATAVVTLSSLGIFATSQAAPPAIDHTSLPPVQTAPPVFDESLFREVPLPVDLHGNEVTPAIAKYKLDAWGSLYEEHSPHTELPRLGNPKG
jgi:hypothetical protein